MEPRKKEAETIYWHPAFFADIQIELKDDADNLIFENEHQLGKKPMEIDVLIIKKEKDRPVKKNIGRIFKKYNIVEYKGPGDFLSIDDFYKVYGYACFYKADVPYSNSVSVTELTITFVSDKYPRELIRHLETVRNYRVAQTESGIYSVKGDILPIQIIVTKNLSETENLWLKSLTNNLIGTEKAQKLIEDYLEHTENNLYRLVLDTIMRANQKTFEEVNVMTDIFMEIVQEKFDRKLKEETEKAVNAIVNEAVNEAVDKMIKEEREEAKKKVEEARLTDRISLIQKKFAKNKSLAVIADEMESTSDELLPVYNFISKNPDKTAEEIYELISRR
ncbi:MAG: hypothetical protein HFH15_11060 [Ruminococcus sp.]|nr:hypothetical protein [Ruminococcus sp.]